MIFYKYFARTRNLFQELSLNVNDSCHAYFAKLMYILVLSRKKDHKGWQKGRNCFQNLIKSPCNDLQRLCVQSPLRKNNHIVDYKPFRLPYIIITLMIEPSSSSLPKPQLQQIQPTKVCLFVTRSPYIGCGQALSSARRVCRILKDVVSWIEVAFGCTVNCRALAFIAIINW